MSAEARLKELVIDLGSVPAPIANYVNAVRTGNLLFLAGRHARSAVGMGSLPMGIPVEIEVIVEVGNRGQSPISRKQVKRKRK